MNVIPFLKRSADDDWRLHVAVDALLDIYNAHSLKDAKRLAAEALAVLDEPAGTFDDGVPV